VPRLASGYDAGQPEDDQAPVFYILWVIAILSAALNLLFLWALRRHINNGGKFRIIRNLLLPLVINLVLLWFLFIGFPSSMDSDYSVMFVYLPDTSLIFLICSGVIVLTMFLRLGVYLRSRTVS